MPGQVQTGHWEKVLHRQGGLSLEQTPQQHGHRTKCVRVQGASQQHLEDS